MRIRKATLKDIPKIAELIKVEFNKPPYSDGWTIKSAKRTLNNYFNIGYGIVAFSDKKIVGALIARDDPYAKGLYIVIEELVVSTKMQGKGIGKKLVQELEKIAKKKKAHILYLYSHKKSKAFQFYKKLGYKESKDMVTLGKKLEQNTP